VVPRFQVKLIRDVLRKSHLPLGGHFDDHALRIYDLSKESNDL
jgi:hypothetical protein